MSSTTSYLTMHTPLRLGYSNGKQPKTSNSLYWLTKATTCYFGIEPDTFIFNLSLVSSLCPPVLKWPSLHMYVHVTVWLHFASRVATE